MDSIIILVIILLTGILILECYLLITGLKNKRIRSVFKYSTARITPDKKLLWVLTIINYVITILIEIYFLIKIFILLIF
jgi:hypothetical protein